jgi:hypothetical protein
MEYFVINFLFKICVSRDGKLVFEEGGATLISIDYSLILFFEIMLPVKLKST